MENKQLDYSLGSALREVKSREPEGDREAPRTPVWAGFSRVMDS